MRDSEVDTQRTSREFSGELMIWLSPAFPVGGFAYSQGLESAVAKNWVTDFATLADWIKVTVKHGALRNDLILMGLVVRAATEAEVDEFAQLAVALQPSAERAKESLDQGRSFWAAYQAAWQTNPDGTKPGDESLALPVAIGLAAREHGFSAKETLEAYAICFVSNQVSAAIRLGVIGQFDGQRIIADLLPQIRLLADFAASAMVDDLGTSAYGADLASMLHETQTTRLFRS